MMPVYLPFTTLGAAAAAALMRFFNQVVLYRPLENPAPQALDPWLAAGRIELRVPVADPDRRLARSLAACHQWARERDLGGGEAGAFLKAQPKGAPLYDEDAVGRLRRQILAGGQPEQAAAPEDPLFDARLFLAMAELHDQDSELATHQLQRLQSAEERLLHEMHAGDPGRARIGPPTAAIAAAEDRGAFKTGERLRAWAILAGQDTAPPSLLVTDSPAVAADLLERRHGDLTEPPRLLLQLPPETIPAHETFKDRLGDWLAQVTAADGPGTLFSPEAVDLPFGREGIDLDGGGGPTLGLHLLTDCPCARLVETLLPKGMAPRWRTDADTLSHGLIAVVRP